MSWSNTAGYTTELSNLNAETNSNPSYFSSENLSAYQVGAGKKKKRTESRKELVKRLVKALRTKKRPRTARKKKPVRKKHTKKPASHKRKKPSKKRKRTKRAKALGDSYVDVKGSPPASNVNPMSMGEAYRMWKELDMAELAGAAVGRLTERAVRGGITAGQMGLEAGYNAGYNALQWLYEHRREIADGTKESMVKMKEFLDNTVLDRENYIKLLDKMKVDPSVSVYPKYLSMWGESTANSDSSDSEDDTPPGWSHPDQLRGPIEPGLEPELGLEPEPEPELGLGSPDL